MEESLALSQIDQRDAELANQRVLARFGWTCYKDGIHTWYCSEGAREWTWEFPLFNILLRDLHFDFDILVDRLTPLPPPPRPAPAPGPQLREPSPPPPPPDSVSATPPPPPDDDYQVARPSSAPVQPTSGPNWIVLTDCSWHRSRDFHGVAFPTGHHSTIATENVIRDCEALQRFFNLLMIKLSTSIRGASISSAMSCE